jgi:hypothetical protein
LGIQGELHAAFNAQQISLFSDMYTSQAHNGHAKGDIPALEGDMDSTHQHQTPHGYCIIIWAHICIILHNLIIHIKGNNFDKKWKESLVRTGLDHERDMNSDADNEDKAEDALGWAQC